MADSAQEKTEQPTPKKRKEAKEKGQVVKSVELNSVVIMAGAIITLYFITFCSIIRSQHTWNLTELRIF